MIVSQPQFAGMAIVVAMLCTGPAIAQTNGGSATGASASSTAGRVSAPPANSAMRRAGSGTVAAQPATAAAQGGMATPTNAMTLTSDGGMGGAQATNAQAGQRSGAQPQASVSIDSNGITRRSNETQTPR